MITMRLYRVERDGFRKLWIDQAETNAKASDGTTLKITLSDAGAPQVEVKADFLRVTVRRPSADNE